MVYLHTMQKELRTKAIKMRVTEHLSYSAISKALDVPKSTLSYWLREYPLSEERILELRRKGWSKGEASRERYRNTMRKKKEVKDEEEYKHWLKYFKKTSKKDLMIAGLMLYVGEGGKKKDSQLTLANTDPEVIELFLLWIEKCFQIPRSEVRIQLHLYESMNLDKEQKVWQDTLRLKKEQFYKSSVRKLQPHSFTYSSSHGHGTCSVYVFGTERRRAVAMATKAFLELLKK